MVGPVLAVVLISGGKSGFSYDDPFDRYPKGGVAGTVREPDGAADSNQRLGAWCA